ncbi:MAG: CinA family protein [Oscillospiraceae bacterium]|nr:CinA family protein [Oscillospiraceae bacterium]
MDEIIYNHKHPIENLDKTVTQVVKLLLLSNKLIASAESCTGGMISQLITSVSGASSVFELGICSYSNRIKHQILGVPQEIIDKYTEVSAQTAICMAEGVKKISGADISVSVTGIAGPTGGTPDKPVGTVYAGFVYNDLKFAKLFKLTDKSFDREAIRKYTALSVLEIVEYLLTEDV